MEEDGYVPEVHLPYRFMPGGEFGKHALSSPDGLNDRLNTEYLDVEMDDTSICAKITRLIAGCVSRYFTPNQILIVLRLLKASTFCFLVMAIISDLMYLLFVKILSSGKSVDKLGDCRDTILRIYGLLFAFMAMMLELDIPRVVKHIAGFKNFIPRGLLLFFVSVVTNTSPHLAKSKQVYNSYDDDLYDDNVVTYSEIPVSAIVFQMATSGLLAICALIYIILGLTCCDRFTSRAFTSTTDPLISTAIPATQSPSHFSDIDSISKLSETASTLP